jgi:hypothetical protein
MGEKPSYEELERRVPELEAHQQQQHEPLEAARRGMDGFFRMSVTPPLRGSNSRFGRTSRAILLDFST